MMYLNDVPPPLQWVVDVVLVELVFSIFFLGNVCTMLV